MSVLLTLRICASLILTLILCILKEQFSILGNMPIYIFIISIYIFLGGAELDEKINTVLMSVH